MADNKDACGCDGKQKHDKCKCAGKKRKKAGPGDEQVCTEPAPDPTAPPNPVPARLAELEKALGGMSVAMDAFEGMLGLCERMAAKSQRIAAMSDRWAAWPPMTLLHSSAVVSKRELLEEMERMSGEMARLGAEYRLLKSENEQREEDGDA